MDKPVFERLPKEFVSNMAQTLGEAEARNLCDALMRPPVVSVRMNPSKLCGTDIFDTPQPVEWCDHGFRLPDRPRFTLMPHMHAGAFYVQDASSMIMAEVVKRLTTGNGTPVCYLDACAAPGGKTTAAISALPPHSLAVANEFVPQRAQILRENLIKWGYPSTIVTQGDTEAYKRIEGIFDIVAVDAPCSGEGMMRKDEEACRQWSPGLISQCAAMQREILENVWPALRPGGYLVYSTCTFNKTENENMVRWLANETGASVIDLELPPEWGIGASLDSDIPALRFMPHMTEGEGLFLAVLRKAETARDSLPKAYKSKKTKHGSKPSKVPEIIKSWIKNDSEYTFRTTADGIWQAFPTMHTDTLQRIIKECPVIGCGIDMCMEKGRDLVPGHSLALSTAMADDAFPRAALDTEQALSYLRRETVTLPQGTPKGYVVVTYDGLPLGFVKNLGNRSNNLYPQQWRIRHL